MVEDLLWRHFWKFVDDKILYSFDVIRDKNIIVFLQFQVEKDVINLLIINFFPLSFHFFFYLRASFFICERFENGLCPFWKKKATLQTAIFSIIQKSLNLITALKEDWLLWEIQNLSHKKWILVISVMSYQTGKINIFIIFANIVWGRREERKEEALGGVVFVRGAGRGNDTVKISNVLPEP